MKTLMEIQKKKHVLLEDKALDWLQIWTAASSLDLNGIDPVIFCFHFTPQEI